MLAVETFLSWFLSSKHGPAGSVHLPTRKEPFTLAENVVKIPLRTIDFMMTCSSLEENWTMINSMVKQQG